MIVYDSQTIILAIIGFIGVLSTGVVVTTAFKRNRTATGKWQ